MTDTNGMNIKPSQFDVLAKLVDVSTVRHRVLANNIANVNTPGFKRMDLHFEETLASQLKRDGKIDLQMASAEVRVDKKSPSRVDGNNVDIDNEIGTMQKNLLLHNTYLQIISNRSSQMRQAISGR